MRKVCREIDDCRDSDHFLEQCEKMLKADFGMNYADLIELLEFIATSRISALDNCSNCNNNNFTSPENDSCRTHSSPPYPAYKFNDFHLEEDLRQIHHIVLDIIEDVVLLEDHQSLLDLCLSLERLLHNSKNRGIF